jgi:hypothetical protein
MMKEFIKRNYFYLAIILILLVFAYVTWLNHTYFETSVINQAKHELLSLDQSLAENIEKNIMDIHREMNQISLDTVVLENLKTHENNNYELLRDSYKDLEKFVDSIYLIDGKGKVIDSIPSKEEMGKDLSRISDVRMILNNHQAYTSEIFLTPQGEQAIATVHPILENGEFIGLLRTIIKIQRLNNLVMGLNEKGKRFALILDKRFNILNFPDAGYIGKNIISVLKEKISEQGLIEFRGVLEKIQQGQGVGQTETLRFFSPWNENNFNNAIIAFTPLYINDSESWTVLLVMNYNLVGVPINRNAAINFLFALCAISLLLLLGMVFYREEKKKAEMDISATAMDIINKQLHLEIKERRQIEEELQKTLQNKRRV